MWKVRPRALGKQAGADASLNKPTYPSVLGLEESRRHARDLHHAALAALAPFGDAAEPLAWLVGIHRHPQPVEP